MKYSTVNKVRHRVNVTSSELTDSKIQEFIEEAEKYIDQVFNGDPRKISKSVDWFRNQKFIDLDLSEDEVLKAIERLWVNGRRIRKMHPNNLLDDGECEEEDSAETNPEYWTSLSSITTATYTWSTTAFKRSRSLQIENTADAAEWESDDVTIDDSYNYRAKCQLRLSSDFSGNAYLKIRWYGSGGSVLSTNSSLAKSAVEITQPSSASVIAIVSDDDDDKINVLVNGIVSGVEASEVVTLNGTTSVSTKQSFSEISSVVKSKESEGTITATSNSAAVTNCSLTLYEIRKDLWMEILVEATSPANAVTASVVLVHEGSAGSIYGDNFELRKRNWEADEARALIWVPGLILSEDDIINVEFRRVKHPDLVEDISTNLGAIYALVSLCGGRAAGLNYEVGRMKIDKGTQFNNRLRLIFELKIRVKSAIAELQKELKKTTKLVIGEFGFRKVGRFAGV